MCECRNLVGVLQKKKSQNCAESNIMCVFKEKLKGNSFLIEEQEGVVPHYSEDVLQSIL